MAAREDPQPPHVQLEAGQLGLLYDMLKREIGYVREDFSELRTLVKTTNEDHKRALQLLQVAMTHISERVTEIEQQDHDAAVTREARRQIRKRVVSIALGSATFASCVAATVAVFVH